MSLLVWLLSGQAKYEKSYNGGMGLSETLQRVMMFFAKYLAEISRLCATVPNELVYSGSLPN
jgi:hypothetical protein